jgi:hypothetical protein
MMMALCLLLLLHRFSCFGCGVSNFAVIARVTILFLLLITLYYFVYSFYFDNDPIYKYIFTYMYIDFAMVL